MSDDIYNVLFLCTGNSARSIMGEAILNRMGAGRFKAFSAGSRPKGSVHPETMKLLQALDYDITGARSKGWEEFARPGAPSLDFVFTVCDDAAGEVCPVWPGQPMSAHWGLPDPAAATGEAFEVARVFSNTYRMLHARIGLFTSLPLRSIGGMSLQRQLDAIGHPQDRKVAS